MSRLGDEIRIGLVGVGTGGPSSYHARSFSSIINGFDPTTTPAGWPTHAIPVTGARVVTVWDENREAAQALADVFSIDRVASDLTDVSADVDAVIVVDDITLTHQRRAIPFLERGLPTFIDKPLSNSLAEATELVELAARSGAPLMSTSALRYARETQEAQARVDAAGELSLAIAVCQGQYLGEEALIHYGIHPLELAYSVLGPGVESVENVANASGNVVNLTYRDGRTLVLLVFPDIAQTFRLDLYGATGSASILVEDWDAFYAEMLQAFVQMVRDRAPPVPLTETLEVIHVLTAAMRSRSEGGATIMLGEHTRD